MIFGTDPEDYCTISITVRVKDKEKLYDLVEESRECYSSPQSFVRSAINSKLESMGIEFKLP